MYQYKADGIRSILKSVQQNLLALERAGREDTQEYREWQKRANELKQALKNS